MGSARGAGDGHRTEDLSLWVEFTETGLQKVLEWRGWWTTLAMPSSGTAVGAEAGEVSRWTPGRLLSQLRLSGRKA